MTALRQRMLEDLRIRNYAPATVRCYVRVVAEFAQHFNKPPDQLGAEEVRRYKLFLLNEKCVKLSSYIKADSTAQFGKCHEVPVFETTPIGPFHHWPTGSGFEHFYGFIGGENNQYYPALYDGTTPIEPERTPEEGYHPDGTKFADKSDPQWMRQQKAIAPDESHSELSIKAHRGRRTHPTMSPNMVKQLKRLMARGSARSRPVGAWREPRKMVGRLLAYVTGSVNQELLLQNEYLAAENRILRAKVPSRLRLSDPERATLAEIGRRMGRKALREVACVTVAGITRHPDQEWMEQIARSATQETWGYLHPCRYVLHDRDTKFCASFRSVLAAGGVKAIPLPARSPNLNAFAERLEFTLPSRVLVEVDPVRRGRPLSGA